MTPGQNCDSLSRITRKKRCRGMSNLGRRELLTGLAAVAVAGVAAALPVRAASVAWQITPRQVVLSWPWHFDYLPDGTIKICHPSPMGFANAPRLDGSPVFDCFLEDGKPSIEPVFRAYERAATFVAKHAYLIRFTRGHKGAIYFDYTQHDPRRPFDDIYTQDAPPRLVLREIYALRGIDWDAL